MAENYRNLTTPSRRVSPRFKVEASATIIVNSRMELPAVVKDLSFRGAGVVCDFPLDQKDKIKIVIVSSLFDNPVTRDAQVVWTKKIKNEMWDSGLDFGMNQINFQ